VFLYEIKTKDERPITITTPHILKAIWYLQHKRSNTGCPTCNTYRMGQSTI